MPGNVCDVTTTELADRLCERAAHIAAATYRFLVDLAEFDRRDGWGGEGVRSLAHWLNWKCGYDLRTARELVRVARALESLPKLSETFEKGALSYSKVRALTRIATPETEEAILGFGNAGTAEHVERLVRYYRKWAPTDPDDATAVAQKVFLECTYDDDGTGVMRARLTASDLAVVVKAIDKVEDELRADQGTGNGSAEPRLLRAEALVELARRELSGERSGVPAGERYQVVVHVDAETLSGGEGICYLEDGGALPSETLKRLMCDTTFVMVVEDEDGTVRKITKRNRTIPTAKRRALKVRDRQCRFPGCTSKRFLDAHHIQYYMHDGDHELDNLVLLCPYHHRLQHEGLFSVRYELDGRFTFIHKGGWAIETAAFVVEPGGVERENAALGIEIGKDTIAAKWGGESCDYGIAVEHLIGVNGRRHGSAEPLPPTGSVFAPSPETFRPDGFDAWSLGDKVMWEVRMQQSDECVRTCY